MSSDSSDSSDRQLIIVRRVFATFGVILSCVIYDFDWLWVFKCIGTTFLWWWIGWLFLAVFEPVFKWFE
jgi:hypothetical protein